MSNQLQISGAAKIRSIQGPVVANSGVISALDGDASQYVRGDGTLADFPTSTGGGSSVSYYLNTSVSQGTIGGVAYKQLSKVPISGAGTDVTISANGYIASYLTDANDPALLEVPAGNFNCEFYFSVNSNAHNPYVYAEVYKYDGTTFTLLGSSQSVPEYLTNGTTLSPYYFAIPVATSVLTITDRIAIRIYVNVDGRTVTLHTENNHLCQVVTTFSKGLTTLNSLTRQVQFFQTGTSGTDFAISSSVATHTFNLPVASAANTGKLSSTDWSTFNGKVPYTGATANVNLGVYSLEANTFAANGNNTLGGTIALKQNGQVVATTGYAYIGSESAGKLNIYFGDTGLEAAILDNSLLTATRTYNLPDASGTLALTSNLSSYVPYTGATANVDLGLFGLTSNAVKAIGDNSTYGGVISIKQNNVIGGLLGTGYTELFGKTNRLGISFGAGSIAYLSNSVLTAERTYTLPDASGTLALTSDLSSYVPYTGATAQLNLGLNDLSARFIFAEGGGGIAPTLGFLQTSLGAVSTTNHTNIYVQNYNIIGFTFYQASAATKNFAFDVSGLDETTIRTYTMPNASGTLALTSNLSAYLPLTGGTLTGQLYINPTNTATVGLDVASNTTRFRSDNLEGFKRQLEITMGSGTLVQMVAKGFGGTYGTDLAFYTSTSGGVNGSPAMYITGGNKIGIGTGSPSEQLSVMADNAYTSKIRFSYGSSATSYYTNFGYNSDGNKAYLQIADGGAASTIMTWNYNGNVGIGGVSANYLLDVNKTVAGDFIARFLNTSTTGYGLYIQTNDNSKPAIRIANASGATAIDLFGSGAATFSGDVTMSASTGVRILTVSTGGIEGRITATSSAWYIGSQSAIPLVFTTGGAGLMSLATSGNLTLTRTTYSSIQAVGCYDDTSAGARSLSITSAGAIVAVPSSLRYKKDVETLDSNISESIYKMRPIWYRSISNHDRDDWSWYGLIAEEIAEIEPRLVQWGYKREDYIINEETKEQELKEGAELQADGVDYARITVLLVAEMQKLNERLNKAGL